MVDMTPEHIAAVLDEQRIGRLAMADRQGTPYVIPLPFCWLDGCLYLRVPLSGRKGQVLAENPRVCFEVDWYTESLDDYGSVLIEGELVEVAALEEKARVKARNDAKYNRLRQGYRPGHGRATPLERVAMRKIVVTRLSGRMKDVPVAAV